MKFLLFAGSCLALTLLGIRNGQTPLPFDVRVDD